MFKIQIGIVVFWLAIWQSSTFAQWVQVKDSSGGAVRCLASRGKNLFAGCHDIADLKSGGLLTTTNNGASWTKINSVFYPQESFLCFLMNDSNFFAGTEWNFYRSTDNGANWEGASDSLSLLIAPVNCLAMQGKSLFVGSNLRILLSTDSGTNWTIISNGITENRTIKALISTGSCLLAGDAGGHIYRTYNNGSSWEKADSGILQNMEIGCFLSVGTKIFVGTNPTGVFVSSDNGSSWKAVNSGFYPGMAVEDLVVSDTIIFATGTSGVYYSKNNGGEWIGANAGFTPNMSIGTLEVSNGFLFAGTGRNGIWRRPISEMLAVQFKKEYSINSKAFNVIIDKNNFAQYNVPTTSTILINLYDFRGCLVRALVNCVKQAGIYSETLPRGLSQGRYVLSFQAGNTKINKPVMIVK